MRVSIGGAGLAGLSLAWHALDLGMEVVLFDLKGIGAGASGIATGLMHPFPGKTASISWRALEGMKATEALLKVAEEALQKPVAARTGIFRPAVTEEQKRDFKSQENREAVWRSVSCPGLIVNEGLWIERGVTVFMPLYLEGLWQACAKRGAIFRKEPLIREEGVDQYVFAMGDKTPYHLPLRTALGQTALCKYEETIPFSLASHGYVAMTDRPFFCQVGATYEHTEEPDPKKFDELLRKVSLFYGGSLTVLEKKWAVRVSPRDGHRPIVEKVSKDSWVFTGLGSRGLLYHALLGRELALEMQKK